MVTFGIVSLFQAWILPGFLFLLFFKKIKIFDAIVLSIPLSLVLNYILVYNLVLLKIYNQNFLIVIILIELILIILLLIKNYNFKRLLNEIDNFFSFKKNFKTINVELSLINIIVLLLFIIYSFYALNNLGQPVHDGDPLDMWNSWALSWSKNEIPLGVEYPQAVPILYSISYVLISNYEVEYFTSAVCLIYPIWIFVTFFRLIYLFPEKKLLIKMTLVITTFFLLSILRNYTLFIGFSDPILVSVTLSSCFIFLFFFFTNQNYDLNHFNFKQIILISLVASSPAITKQMGLLVSFLFPVFFLIIHHFKKKYFKNFFLMGVIIFFISLSWYFFPIYEYFLLNFDPTETYFGKLSSDSMSKFQNTSMISKLNFGLEYLFWKFKYLILFFVLLAINNKYASLVLFLIVIPYFCIWSLFFVVDNRNFVMISPFLGFILSIGINNFLKILSLFNIKFIKSSKLILIAIFTFLFFFILKEIKNEEKLIFKSIEDKKLRGFPETNILLYNYLKNSDKEYDIITVSANVFKFLPDIGHRFVRSGCEEFINLIDNKYKDKNYYLLLNKDYCELDNLYKDRLSSLKIENIFGNKKHDFYLITN
jgi:hypothetical protein